MTTPWTHHHAALHGVRLHYVSAGQGKPIVFLHGFPELWRAWRRQLTEFSRDHHAVALDMRGYNLSDKPAEVEAYGIQHLVGDVVALLDHLGADRAAIVGHDWGGAVAWSVALRHPERVERLVAINISHPAILNRELRENPAQQAASQYMHAFKAPGAEASLAKDGHRTLLDLVVDPGIAAGHFTEEDRRAYLEAWSQPGALTGGLNYYRAARLGPPGPGKPEGGSNLVDDLASLTVRLATLVIWGEQDPYLLTGNLVGLEELVPDLTIERVPDATHWVVHEAPDRVNAAIRRFLSR